MNDLPYAHDEHKCDWGIWHSEAACAFIWVGGHLGSLVVVYRVLAVVGGNGRYSTKGGVL